MTLLVVVLDALGVPVLYTHLLSACSGEAGADAACVPGALSPEQLRQLSVHGLSVRSYAGAVIGLELFTTVIFLAVATLIFWRRAESRIALYCATTLVLFGGTFAGPGSGGPMRALIVLAPFWNLLVDSLRVLGNVCFAALFYLFPSGRWVPHWTRWLMIPWMLVAIVQEVFPSSSVNPGQTGMLGNLLFAGLVSTIVVAQVYRYRAVSTTVERHQSKWVVFGSALGIVVLVVTSLLLPRVTPAVSPIASLDRGAAISLAIVVVPVSVAVAILRSHLFDIDRLINRTLVYGGLTGIVAGGYILIVGALGALFQTRGNLVISLVGAGVVAVVFQPLRVALQRVVDRMLFGERDDPYTVISRLGRRLEATLAPEALLPAIVETVAQALKLPRGGDRRR
jgi:hypothetical protein